MNLYLVDAGEVSFLRNGLRPYPHPQLTQQGISDPVIWLWPRRLCGRAHWGQLIWTMARHETPRVVVLTVRYSDEDVLKLDPGVNVFHSGALSTQYNTFSYHVDEPAVLLARKIPGWRVGFDSSYDIRKKEGRDGRP